MSLLNVLTRSDICVQIIYIISKIQEIMGKPTSRRTRGSKTNSTLPVIFANPRGCLEVKQSIASSGFAESGEEIVIAIHSSR